MPAPDHIRRLVARSRAAQGLPERITDPAAIARAVAALTLAERGGGVDAKAAA